MSLSLRDQLLKAGLVNQKQVSQANKAEKKQKRLEHKGQVEVDDSQQRMILGLGVPLVNVNAMTASAPAKVVVALDRLGLKF